MRIALDTNAYSDFMRADAERVRFVTTASELHLPLFVLAELRAGFARGTRARQNESGLQQFLSSTRTRVLLPDEATTYHYAALHRQLAQQGTPIPANDLWIAAVVLQHNLVLCSSDQNFDHIPQLPRC